MQPSNKVRRFLQSGALILVATVTVLAFQNCGQKSNVGNTDVIADTFLPDPVNPLGVCENGKRACETDSGIGHVLCDNVVETDDSLNICVLESCKQGFNLDSATGKCNPNECDPASAPISCDLAYGVGERTCGADFKYSKCTVKSCDEGYYSSGGLCKLPSLSFKVAKTSILNLIGKTEYKDTATISALPKKLFDAEKSYFKLTHGRCAFSEAAKLNLNDQIKPITIDLKAVKNDKSNLLKYGNQDFTLSKEQIESLVGCNFELVVFNTDSSKEISKDISGVLKVHTVPEVCAAGESVIGQTCGACPSEQKYNATARICEPIIIDPGPCPANQELKDGKCQPIVIVEPKPCKDTEVLINGKCEERRVCAAIYTYNPEKNSCEPITPVCTTDKIKIDGKCVTKPICTSDQVYDEKENKCKPRYVIDPRPCKKDEVYNKINKKCELAPVDPKLCKPTEVLINGKCEERRVCAAIYTYNPERNTCEPIQPIVCTKEKVLINGRCELKPICTSDQFYDEKENKCKPRLVIDPPAPQCRRGLEYDEKQKKCVPCDENERFNETSKKCEPRFVVDPPAPQCPIGQEFDEKQKKCVPCDINERFNETSKKCEPRFAVDPPAPPRCKLGEVFSKGKCEKKAECNRGERYIEERNVCEPRFVTDPQGPTNPR